MRILTEATKSKKLQRLVHLIVECGRWALESEGWWCCPLLIDDVQLVP